MNRLLTASLLVVPLLAGACVLNNNPGEPSRAGVDSFPVDSSPYGVRGMAGGW